MKTLSLTQPWAQLVALGAKRIETRSWGTSYRGWLAIHAAKGLADMDEHDLMDLCQQDDFYAALEPALPRVEDTLILDWRALPRGAVVAVARLVSVVRITEAGMRWALFPPHEQAFGNYAPGRYAWLLGNVTPLAEPIAARGRLGLWNWDAPARVLALIAVDRPQADARAGHVKAARP